MAEPHRMEGTQDEPARRLQDLLDEQNAAEPADHSVPYFLANFRHLCAKARQSAKLAGKGVSTAIDLKERYVVDEVDPTHALVYREGSCKKCGQTARSEVGWVVLTAERPPAQGRVARA